MIVNIICFQFHLFKPIINQNKRYNSCPCCHKPRDTLFFKKSFINLLVHFYKITISLKHNLLLLPVVQILSWCVIGLGIYAEIMRSKFTEYEHFLMTPSVILILIGCFMLFFSFTGFLGALRDNFFMLKMVSLTYRGVVRN